MAHLLSVLVGGAGYGHSTLAALRNPQASLCAVPRCRQDDMPGISYSSAARLADVTAQLAGPAR